MKHDPKADDKRNHKTTTAVTVALQEIIWRHRLQQPHETKMLQTPNTGSSERLLTKFGDAGWGQHFHKKSALHCYCAMSYLLTKGTIELYEWHRDSRQE